MADDASIHLPLRSALSASVAVLNVANDTAPEPVTAESVLSAFAAVDYEITHERAGIVAAWVNRHGLSRAIWQAGAEFAKCRTDLLMFEEALAEARDPSRRVCRLEREADLAEESAKKADALALEFGLRAAECFTRNGPGCFTGAEAQETAEGHALSALESRVNAVLLRAKADAVAGSVGPEAA